MGYDSIFIIVIGCLSLVSGLPDCDSKRPKTRKGYSRHRTLYIPDKFLSNSNSENNWANALCCVYTHVEKTSKKKAELEVYDGWSYKISGDSFEEIAEEASKFIIILLLLIIL